ncbi:MAG: glycosyltransferase, partial [Oscillospiraceae bacterium]
VFTGISLDRNRGHQTALTEGLMAARAERAVSISIDADLQDDVDAIDAMAEKRREGAHIVCGVRASRQTDTFMKRFTARSYYRLMRFFGSDLIYDHADFRLMDPEALDRLALYHGDDLFLRGLITRLGLPCETVSYDRAERFAGESKYTLKKMLKLALKGAESGRMKPMSVPREPYGHTGRRWVLSGYRLPRPAAPSEKQRPGRALAISPTRRAASAGARQASAAAHHLLHRLLPRLRLLPNRGSLWRR